MVVVDMVCAEVTKASATIFTSSVPSLNEFLRELGSEEVEMSASSRKANHKKSEVSNTSPQPPKFEQKLLFTRYKSLNSRVTTWGWKRSFPVKSQMLIKISRNWGQMGGA